MTRAQPYDRDTALDAAMTLFWQKGYYATSLKDLEGALKMKPGSIYAAFDSKENLFLLALERYFDLNRAEFREAMATHTSPLQALADFLRGIGHAEQEDPARCACMLLKTLLNTTQDDAAIAQQVSEYLEQAERELTAVFEDAKRLGDLPDDADAKRLARRFQSDLTALKIEGQRKVDPAQLAASAEDLARDIEALRKR